MSTIGISCTRRIQFCAGHRVMGHENKCAHMHGHNYVVYVTARAVKRSKVVDDVGRVIDFSVLKQRLGGWIEANWDHGFLLHEHDSNAIEALLAFGTSSGIMQKTYLLPCNPTAEMLADFLLFSVCPGLFEDTEVEIERICVWETENCFAEAFENE